ncbi:MAG: Stp1/IreP family PP2C-type Ser/Thr phosphatase [Bacteroidota bacterium]
MIKKISLFGTTDVGQLRDHNEDNFVIAKDLSQKLWSYKRDEVVELSEKGALLVVADGMGGTNAGEVASDIAQQSVQKAFDELHEMPSDDDSMAKFIKNAIIQAHETIVSHQQDHLDTAGMGTTLVIAWITREKMHVGWSGDSRCYIYRGNEDLAPFTDDHSLVWELVKKGKLTAEEARNHPESNIITQSLGEPSRPPKPQTKTIDLYQSDKVLLCSDGLNGMLSDEQIKEYLEKDIPVAQAAKELTDAANKEGGTDNITVLLAEVIEGEPKPVMTAEAYAGEANKLTRTGALRKKIKTRNISLAIAAAIITGLMAWQFFTPGKDAKPTKNKTIQGKSTDFIPGERHTLNLADLLTGRPLPVDSISLNMDFRETANPGEISYILSQEQPKDVAITLFTIDTVYEASVLFRPRVLDKGISKPPGQTDNQSNTAKKGDKINSTPEKNNETNRQKSDASKTEKQETTEKPKKIPENEEPSEGTEADTSRSSEDPKNDKPSMPELNKIEKSEESDSVKKNDPKKTDYAM